ncbi:MAG: GAF domain-containing protein [Spirochaetes bacterium]|nr:GAF domain-containing protein [Spirochaetota bacterium]
MQKLVLKVSEKVPEIPAPARKQPGMSVTRIARLGGRQAGGETLVAYLLDRAFIEKNSGALREAAVPPGSVLLWNPGAETPLPPDVLPEGLLFDEVFSFKNPPLFLRTLRNLFRRLFLERELARKEELLRLKESENSELLQVGIALSAERDNDKLLAYILRQLREITRADAGTLYLLERDEASGEQKMRFKITQNDSNPTDFSEFVMPLSKKTISGYVASTGTVLNIEDVYDIPSDREYGFGKKYDEDTGYRSKSMLTVPMQDHKGEILGVIQLINRKKDFSVRLANPREVDSRVVPFSREIEPLVMSLASQAAVSLENNLLYQEIETFFEGFVKASVQAIESRDPTTSGHSNRVAIYTVGLAKAVDRIGSGSYRDVHFTPEHLKEIRYASLLHDFGKVGVREHVLVKARKLYGHQLDLVKMRFAYIQKAMLYGLLKERFDSLCNGGLEGYMKVKGDFDRREEEWLAEIDAYLKTIITADEPKVLDEEPARILDEVHGKMFLEKGGQAVPFLTDDEYTKLRIRRGSLDEAERKEIESHVTHTFLFLRTIPWTKEMRNIPAIAYGHHEKLDGDGYPRKLLAADIPVQSRMMTVSDIYDALTASDRPYKRAVPPRQALDILTKEVEMQKLDRELVDIFIESKIWEKKAEPSGP